MELRTLIYDQLIHVSEYSYNPITKYRKSAVRSTIEWDRVIDTVQKLVREDPGSILSHFLPIPGSLLV